VLLTKARFLGRYRGIYLPYFNYLNILVIFLGKVLGYHVVATFHDFRPHRGDGKAGEYLLNACCALLADRIIALTNAVAAQLQPFGKEMAVIPHPIFFEPTDFGTRDWNSQDREGPLRVLFFGRVLKYKGVDLLVAATKRLLEEGHRIRLSIVGKGDQLVLAETPEISRRNTWVREDEIPDLIRTNDLLVVPYTEATQSGVISIAIASGTPLIATRVGGLTEQVSSNEAFLIPPNDEDALVEAMRSFCVDRKLLALYSEKISGLQKQYAVSVVSSMIGRFLN
jgi:glycosyltransferase involved in cell wall biosynthesis